MKKRVKNVTATLISLYIFAPHKVQPTSQHSSSFFLSPCSTVARSGCGGNGQTWWQTGEKHALQLSHSSSPLLSSPMPDLSFSSPTLLKGPRNDVCHPIQNIPASRFSLSLTTGNYISMLADVSPHCQPRAGVNQKPLSRLVGAKIGGPGAVLSHRHWWLMKINKWWNFHIFVLNFWANSEKFRKIPENVNRGLAYSWKRHWSHMLVVFSLIHQAALPSPSNSLAFLHMHSF